MNRTLILYDGKQSSAERSAERLCYVVGSSKAVEIDEAPQDLSPYVGVCFVFQFYGSVTAGKLKNYLITHREALAFKRLAVVGVGYSDLGYTKYVVDMEKEVGLEGFAGYFIASDSQTTRAGYEIGRMMRAPKKAMDEEELMASIRSFIESHTSLALATATDGYIRCTPLSYTFLDDCFYIATEGGNKFRGIIENGRVSATIFDAHGNLKETGSLQLLGEAEIVPVGSAEYQVAMTAKHITEEQLQELPVTMFLIRLTPLLYDFTNPDFVERGYDAAQALTTSMEKEKSREGREYFAREREKGQPTYTFIDENGEKKQVTIPEIGTNMIPGFYDMHLPEDRAAVNAAEPDWRAADAAEPRRRAADMAEPDGMAAASAAPDAETADAKNTNLLAENTKFKNTIPKKTRDINTDSAGSKDSGQGRLAEEDWDFDLDEDFLGENTVRSGRKGRGLEQGSKNRLWKESKQESKKESEKESKKESKRESRRESGAESRKAPEKDPGRRAGRESTRGGSRKKRKSIFLRIADMLKLPDDDGEDFE